MSKSYRDRRDKYFKVNDKKSKSKNKKSKQEIYPNNKKWDVETGEYIE